MPICLKHITTHGSQHRLCFCPNHKLTQRLLETVILHPKNYLKDCWRSCSDATQLESAVYLQAQQFIQSNMLSLDIHLCFRSFVQVPHMEVDVKSYLAAGKQCMYAAKCCNMHNMHKLAIPPRTLNSLPACEVAMTVCDSDQLHAMAFERRHPCQNAEWDSTPVVPGTIRKMAAIHTGNHGLHKPFSFIRLGARRYTHMIVTKGVTEVSTELPRAKDSMQLANSLWTDLLLNQLGGVHLELHKHQAGNAAKHSEAFSPLLLGDRAVIQQRAQLF